MSENPNVKSENEARSSRSGSTLTPKPLLRQRRMEQELHHTREVLELLAERQAEALSLLSATLNASPDAVAAFDWSGRLIASNANFARLWGFQAGSLPGIGAEDIRQRCAALAQDPAVFAELPKPDAPGECVSVALRDGRILERYVSAKVLDGKPSGIVVHWRDVTERNAVEAQLRQAQKLEAIGQLAGGIAHDFNNLLAVVQGNLELLRDEMGGNAIAAECVDDALAATARGAGLTHRLLAYSRQLPLSPESVDIGELLEDTSNVLRRILEASIDLKVIRAPDLELAKVDRHQLEDALLNLVVNARDAMPNGGSITVVAENARLSTEDCREHPGAVPGNYVMVAVSDTGVGIPDALAPRVLEPFFTTKSVGKGTGLGLSVVYGFVSQSHGHLTLDSKVERGTTVRMYLPRVEPRLGQAVSDRQTSLPVERSVLVVEDEVAVRRLMLRFLRLLGYRTIEAEDGPAALAVLDQTEPVDLLLTDIVMPGGLNGTELYRQARQRRPGLKVVFMSGYASQSVIRDEEFLKFPILSKPFSRDSLAQTLDHAFG